MTPAVVIRWFFALDALGWALVLVQPGHTFALSRSFAGMAEVMSEGWWAVAFMLAAGVILLSFQMGGQRRVAVTAGIGVGHAMLALTFARSSALLSTGTVTHGAALLLVWWLLGQDLRQRNG